MKQIRIPKTYYDDHIDCEVEAPKVIRENETYYFIDTEPEDHLEELYSRAAYYADPRVHGQLYFKYIGLCRSARWTVEAIDKYRKEQGNE